jgi:hypothetical protein
MPRFRYTVAIALVLLTSCGRHPNLSAACPANPTSQFELLSIPNASGIVAGEVVDLETGNAVANVTITLTPDIPPVQTDSLGRFRIASVAARRYRLTLRRLGYKTTNLDSIAVAADVGMHINVHFAQTIIYEYCVPQSVSQTP